jgi:hypothetical protein
MAFHPKFIEPLTLQQAGSPWALSQEYVFALSDLSTWLGRYLIAYGVWLGRHRPAAPWSLEFHTPGCATAWPMAVSITT